MLGFDTDLRALFIGRGLGRPRISDTVDPIDLMDSVDAESGTAGHNVDLD